MATNELANPPVERHINWGGVLKGALVVTGIAVAAVVGLWAFGAIGSYVTGAATASPGVSALLSGVQSGGTWLIGQASWLAGGAAHLISQIPAGLASILGLTGQHFAGAAAVNSVIGVGGAVVAGGAAAHALLPSLDHTQITTTSPADTGLTHMAGAVPLHDIAHMTHHAGEHANETTSASWSQRFQPRTTSYASFADNVRAQKDERKPSMLQPADSFTDQLNADRANLDTALAK